MKVSMLHFDWVYSFYYKFHKISQNGGGLYIGSPNSIQTKKQQ